MENRSTLHNPYTQLTNKTVKVSNTWPTFFKWQTFWLLVYAGHLCDLQGLFSEIDNLPTMNRNEFTINISLSIADCRSWGKPHFPCAKHGVETSLSNVYSCVQSPVFPDYLCYCEWVRYVLSLLWSTGLAGVQSPVFPDYLCYCEWVGYSGPLLWSTGLACIQSQCFQTTTVIVSGWGIQRWCGLLFWTRAPTWVKITFDDRKTAFEWIFQYLAI